MGTKKLKNILNKLFNIFPYLERVAAYAGPKDILDKNISELIELKNAGLTMLYLGIESGSDHILENVKKGVNTQEMIEAGQRVVKVGIELSCMIISGLGGQQFWRQHALESARVINAINPDFLAFLTLLVEEGTLLSKEIKNGEFKLLPPEQVVEETKRMLENLQLANCVFRSNHPSNYLTLKGILNKDKDRLLTILMEVQQSKNEYRPEGWRVL